MYIDQSDILVCSINLLQIQTPHPFSLKTKVYYLVQSWNVLWKCLQPPLFFDCLFLYIWWKGLCK